jgi:hypothetical protein
MSSKSNDTAMFLDHKHHLLRRASRFCTGFLFQVLYQTRRGNHWKMESFSDAHLHKKGIGLVSPESRGIRRPHRELDCRSFSTTLRGPDG